MKNFTYIKSALNRIKAFFIHMKNNIVLIFAIILSLTIQSSAILAAPQSPYDGSMVSIPGTVQAENFDNGGEGVAYHDTEISNRGGQYRTNEGVDIESSMDKGSRYNVGWIKADEWLEYTINVQSSGNYVLEARVASKDKGGTFHIEFNGIDRTGSMTIPNTGSNGKWTTLTKKISLNAGQQIMRIYFDKSGRYSVGNLNYVRITQSNVPAPTSTPTQTLAPTPSPTQTPATPTDNGWNLVWSDEFDGTSINKSKWEVYEGETEPYPLGDSCFRPNALTVSGGLAHFAIMRTPTTCYSTDQYGNGGKLANHNYAGAGIGSIFAPSGNVLSEGRWETRARFPNGAGTTAYILLWPADDIWTAEVDFAEAIGSNTNEVTFTQHWDGTNNDKTEEISHSTDITQFHEYAVEMKNGLLKWYVDDQLIATQTQHFATRKMGFAAGTWAGSCASRWPGCPTGTTMPVYLDIDYVRVYT